MKSFNTLFFKLAGTTFILMIFCFSKCDKNNNIETADNGVFYLWCSDHTAAFPITVNFTVNGKSSGASYLLTPLDSFNCNKVTDSIYQNGFAAQVARTDEKIEYVAKDKIGMKWAGSFIPKVGCTAIELTAKNIVHVGALFWSQLTTVQYPIHVTITGLAGDDIPYRSTHNLTCDSGAITKQSYYWWYYDTAGTFAYEADAASGEKWAGFVTIDPNHCASKELIGDTTTIKCTQANLSGSWVRQDDGLYPHTKGMIVSYSQTLGGSISFAPSQSCYKVTDIFWGLMSTNDCSINEYYYNAACVLSGSKNTNVSFTTLKLITVNGVQYVKQ